MISPEKSQSFEGQRLSLEEAKELRKLEEDAGEYSVRFFLSARSWEREELEKRFDEFRMLPAKELNEKIKRLNELRKKGGVEEPRRWWTQEESE